jgi:hypothetical protein
LAEYVKDTKKIKVTFSSREWNVTDYARVRARGQGGKWSDWTEIRPSQNKRTGFIDVEDLNTTIKAEPVYYYASRRCEERPRSSCHQQISPRMPVAIKDTILEAVT